MATTRCVEIAEFNQYSQDGNVEFEDRIIEEAQFYKIGYFKQTHRNSGIHTHTLYITYDGAKNPTVENTKGASAISHQLRLSMPEFECCRYKYAHKNGEQ